MLLAFVRAAFFQQRGIAIDTLFSMDHTDRCCSEVTKQGNCVFSEIVLREPSATGDLEVTHHKRQTTTFRAGAVKIIALSPMLKWKTTRIGKNDFFVMCQIHKSN